MAEAIPRQRVIDELLDAFPGSEKFIESIVASLLDQGVKPIQKSHRSIGTQIVKHTKELNNARKRADESRMLVLIDPTPVNIQRAREADGLVRYYEKELQRFWTEHQVLRTVMDMMGIPAI